MISNNLPPQPSTLGIFLILDFSPGLVGTDLPSTFAEEPAPAVERPAPTAEEPVPAAKKADTVVNPTALSHERQGGWGPPVLSEVGVSSIRLGPRFYYFWSSLLLLLDIRFISVITFVLQFYHFWASVYYFWTSVSLN